MSDVPEKRKPLTPRQRLALWERCKGICALCGEPIDGTREDWIDEHLRPLGLLGGNQDTNRGIAHKRCADSKTYGPTGDLARINKAKNVKAKHLGIKAPSQLRGRTREEKAADRKPKKEPVKNLGLYRDTTHASVTQQRRPRPHREQ